MEHTFPFTNWAYNSLMELFKPSFVKEYLENKDNLTEWLGESHEVQFYHNRIPDFENEIQQIIETNTQEGIDGYFHQLSDILSDLKDKLDDGSFKKTISEFNDISEKEFNEKVSRKEGEFHNHPNRGMKHLEEYEDSYHDFFPIGRGGKPLKLKKVNYNFYSIEDKLDFVDPEALDEYLVFLKNESILFSSVANKYGMKWQNGEIKAKEGPNIDLKPILFCEGDIDIVLIKKAAEILGKMEMLEAIELRYRNGSANLDKLWSILIDNNWETVPQKKILLYDCDTNKSNDDFGHTYRRTIPKQEEHIITRGIENLFPKVTIDKAVEYKPEFVDFREIKGTERGVAYEKSQTIINKHEKRNFCEWVVENGTKEDFLHFEEIFKILETVI